MTAPTIPRSRPQPATHRLRPTTAPRRGGLRADDKFEANIARIEGTVTTTVRDARRAARRAKNVITKNRHKYHRKKMRVATGMVLRTTGVAVAGAYLATRGAVVHGRRAYKRVSPHVRRIAGGAARAGYSYATVFGGHAATTARRKALRAVARQRTAQRRRRAFRADPTYHAAMVATGAVPTRKIRVAQNAARILSGEPVEPQRPSRPRRSRAESRPPRSTSSTTRTRVRDRARSPRPASTSPGTATTAGGNTMNAPVVSTSIHSTNPAYHFRQAFKLIGSYEPESWIGWLQFHTETAKAFIEGNDALTALALRMDVVNRMDPRATSGLYVMGAAAGQFGHLTAATGKTFWNLYQDRFEKNGARGRTMRDENRFFGL